MPEQDVGWVLGNALAEFEGRHRDIEVDLERHFQFVAGEALDLDGAHSDLLLASSRARRLLIGAYFSGEYSVEAAALTNPSIVPAPDQSGLDAGSLRFVLSLRGVGEGHVSSIEFRAGIIGPDGSVTVDEASRYATVGSHEPVVFDKKSFRKWLEEMGAWDESTQSILDSLGDNFELEDVSAAVTTFEDKAAPRHLGLPGCRAMVSLALSNYRLTFPSDSPLSERVIFPSAAVESNGMEDARFVRFVEDDGSITYYATYTAYDGVHVLPQMIETKDFRSFRVDTLVGSCAQNKGAALFPRRIRGKYVALSRHDGENNYVMESDNLRIWEKSTLIESPQASWDLGRIGNCGSPIETEAGWLVVTHGVGPLRVYSLGAILLDLDDPSRVIGRLDEPLLSPVSDEREGYVPNVVYSCGSVVHNRRLVVPYGISDRECSFATVSLDSLLERLA